MADDCSVCDDFQLLINATCEEKDFRWNILKLLCSLTTLLTEEDSLVTPATIILPQVQIDNTDIEASYTDFNAIPSFIDITKQLKKFRIVNTSDSDLDFSFDGGDTTAFTVLSGTEYKDTVNLTLVGLTSFVMKRATGMNAGIGKVIIEGSY